MDFGDNVWRNEANILHDLTDDDLHRNDNDDFNNKDIKSEINIKQSQHIKTKANAVAVVKNVKTNLIVQITTKSIVSDLAHSSRSAYCILSEVWSIGHAH